MAARMEHLGDGHRSREKRDPPQRPEIGHGGGKGARRMRRTSLSAVAGITVFLMTTLAVAQVRYVDEKGVPHWVSSPDEVPQQYRNTATNPRLPEINPQKGGGRSGTLSDRLS